MTVFNLAFLFWGEFLSLIQTLQIIEIAKLWFERQNSDMKMEPAVMCVCVCLYVIDWYPSVAMVGLYHALHGKYGSLK